MNDTQIQKNAAKVAGRLKHDWQNAYVIACSVRLGNGQGRREPLGNSREVTKVGAVEFARQIREAAGGKVYGMGENAIAATLKKWDDLATDPRWNMTPSYDLTPEDADKDDQIVFPDRAWKEEPGSEYVAKTKADDVKSNVSVIKAVMTEDPAFAAQIAVVATEIAPKATATAVAKSPVATTEYATVRKEEMEEAVKAAGVTIQPKKETPNSKEWDATVAARNAVSEWLLLVHGAGAKLHAAEKVWVKIEADLVPGDLIEANATLAEAEADAAILRQRVADKDTSFSTSTAQ